MEQLVVRGDGGYHRHHRLTPPVGRCNKAKERHQPLPLLVKILRYFQLLSFSEKMDKFVVRTPREQHQKKKCVVQEKPLKQATILSLKVS